MIRDSQIVLFTFPRTDQEGGKLRPALVIRQLPGGHNDWLGLTLYDSFIRYSPPAYADAPIHPVDERHNRRAG
jgi:hypothetical protein